MSGKLIRCLCGELYDPEAHSGCPACGREGTSQAAPETTSRTSPPRVSARPSPPPGAPAPVPLPTWWPKATAAAALAVLGLWWLSSTREDAALPADRAGERPRTGSLAQSADGCAQIAGDWHWFTGGFVHFGADGRAFFKPTEDAPPAITAEWVCDESSGDYTVRWAHGFTETIRLYDRGQVVQGTNNVGVAVSGRRYVNPAAGMPPFQIEQQGSQQLPSKLPQLARAASQVARDWRPDARLVSVRIRKEGRMAQTDFFVEQSFVSPSEQTGLWVTTGLTGSKVREAGTVNWGAHELPLDFIDLPVAVRTARAAGLRGLVDRAELSVDGKAARPVWHVVPELHGQGAAMIDAVTGDLVPSR